MALWVDYIAVVPNEENGMVGWWVGPAEWIIVHPAFCWALFVPHRKGVRSMEKTVPEVKGIYLLLVGGVPVFNQCLLILNLVYSLFWLPKLLPIFLPYFPHLYNGNIMLIS